MKLLSLSLVQLGHVQKQNFWRKLDGKALSIGVINID